MVLVTVCESGWLVLFGDVLPLRATWMATSMSALSRFTSSSCFTSLCNSCFWNSSLQDANSDSNCLTRMCSWESLCQRKHCTVKYFVNLERFSIGCRRYPGIALVLLYYYTFCDWLFEKNRATYSTNQVDCYLHQRSKRKLPSSRRRLICLFALFIYCT